MKFHKPFSLFFALFEFPPKNLYFKNYLEFVCFKNVWFQTAYAYVDHSPESQCSTYHVFCVKNYTKSKIKQKMLIISKSKLFIFIHKMLRNFQ